MRKLFSILLGAAICLALVASEAPAYKKVGVSGFSFLKISQGARGVSMGDAVAATTTGIEAAYWNPAGMTTLRKWGVNFSYTKWFVDASLQAGAVGYKLGNHVLALSLTTFNPAETPVTTIFDPKGTGQMISVSSGTVGLAYAVQFTDKFSFGTRFSYVWENLGKYGEIDADNSTVMIDFGTVFHTGYRSLRLGMSFKNFGPDNKLGQVSQSLKLDHKFFMPLTFKIGIADELYGKRGDDVFLTAAIDNVYPIDYDQRVHLGAELGIHNMLYLRGGYKWNYDVEGLTGGVGVKVSLGGYKACLDVAYSKAEYFDNPIRASLNVEF